MTEWILEQLFPQLKSAGYSISSPYDERYNCISYAAEDPQQRWWWPDESSESYWPENVRREETVEAFQKAFEMLGYQPTTDALLESGFQKVAIFVNRRNVPTHAARQLSDGTWTNKLGKCEDITHRALSGVEDIANGECVYGIVAIVLKRPAIADSRQT